MDGRFVDCNWRFERESGYKKEDLTRMTFFTIARSENDVSIFHAVAEMLKDVKAKYKMTTDQLIAELIEESYGARKK